MDHGYSDYVIDRLRKNIKPFMCLSKEEQACLKYFHSWNKCVQELSSGGEWVYRTLDALYQGEIFRIEPSFLCDSEQRYKDAETLCRAKEIQEDKERLQAAETALPAFE